MAAVVGDVASIDRETAQHVLHHFGAGGYRPGSFFTQLIVTIASADFRHKRVLAHVYPGHVAAIDLAQNHEDGIDRLRKIADPES